MWPPPRSTPASFTGCHGAPGVERTETGQGLYPQGPDLAEEAGEYSDGALFWVIKNGVKFTGMPAYGPTHSDEEIWGLVAFLRRLENTSAQEYAALLEQARASQAQDGEEGGHSYAPGAPSHSH